MALLLQALIKDGKLPLLQEMYKTWPFFNVTLDMIEMVFAKVRNCPSGHRGNACHDCCQSQWLMRGCC